MNPENLEVAQVELKTAFPNELVENYRELSPDINLYESQIGVSATIFIVIFMLALIFGIINTMLMAVLERTKELGMLMSIGMNKLRVFGMVVFETVLLGFIGAPIGLLLGWLTVQHFSNVGLGPFCFCRRDGTVWNVNNRLPRFRRWHLYSIRLVCCCYRYFSFTLPGFLKQ